MLFVDENGWDCFFQLAVGLRRAGFRTIRVTTTPFRRAAGQLCFDRTVGVESAEGLERLPEILDGERIVDMQVVDALSVPAVRGLSGLPEHPSLELWRARAATVDKPFVAGQLRGAGLSSPALIEGGVDDPDEVIEVLGLPVVHKVRTGSGGEGVSVLKSRDEVSAMLRSGVHSDSTFFEQFIEGHHLQFAGVIAGEARWALRHLRDVDTQGPHGSGQRPPVHQRCVDGLGRTRCGRGARSPWHDQRQHHPGCRGVDWIHDVNPRAWGSVVAFRAVGIDFLAAYVDFLRGTNRTGRAPTVVSTQTIDVFPASFQIPIEGASNWTNHVRFVRGVLPYVRWVGPRYVMHAVGYRLTNRDPVPIVAPAAPLTR